jgi:hypothetical protein
MRLLFTLAVGIPLAGACAEDADNTTGSSTGAEGGAAAHGGSVGAPTTSGAGAAGTDGTIACGADACDVAAGEVCCYSGPQLERRSCASGRCPQGSVTAACDGPEDCAGGICCGGDLPFTASCGDAADTCEPFYQYCHDPQDCPPDLAYCCALEASSSRVCTPNRITNCAG